MAKLSREAKEQICRSLRDLKGGAVRPAAMRLAEHFGVSIGTIYHIANRNGLRWRRDHRDRGSSRASDAAVLKAGALVYAARRTSNDFPLPACDAVEILSDSGVDLGVGTARALGLLREKRISAADLRRPSPHVRLLSKHPNHVWQFDVTNCLQYFLDEKKGMGERDVEMEIYKNRIVETAKKIKKKLLRYAAVDHCSGAFFFWYYYATGERAVDGADFLLKAMRPKEELIRSMWNGDAEAKLGKYRFHGVPFLIVPDKGAIINDRANQNLFEALRIEVEPHMPGNPRAKGMVEGLMKIINRFEARLRFRRPSSLDELNKWALDWGIKYNAVNLMRETAPRSVLWSYITDEQLRLCPEEKVYRMLIRRPVLEPTADGSCHISVDGRVYFIPDPQAARRKVKVVINAYEYPKVEAHFNGQVWLLEPKERDRYGRLSGGVDYGEYRSHKQTPTQRAKGEMERITEDMGLTWRGTGDKRRAEAPPLGYESPLKVFGHQADKVPASLSFIQRKGKDLDIKQPEMPENRPLAPDAIEYPRMAERRISIMEFLKRLLLETGAIKPELNAAIRARYGDSIGEMEAAEAIKRIKMTGRLPEEEAGEGRESIAI